MKHIGLAPALALVVAFLCAPSSLAQTQQIVPDLHPYQIEVEYDLPIFAPNMVPYYESLKQHKVLERLGQFLTAIKWPQTLRLIAKACGKSESSYFSYDSNRHTITICYEAIPHIENLSGKYILTHPQLAGRFRVGWLVSNVLRQASYALFDMLQVPILTSQDDAADHLTALIALQFSPEVARTVIAGSTLGVSSQRAYDIVCTAYGGQPATFKDFVVYGWLPQSRAKDCVNEYHQAADAFAQKIVKQHYIREALMKKALATTWITAADFK